MKNSLLVFNHMVTILLLMTGVSFMNLNAHIPPDGEEELPPVLEEWVSVYRESNSHDDAYDIAMDSDGNICVTGGSGDEFLTIKYDSDGNILWKARYDGPEGDFGCAKAIALDAENNVYVTGNVNRDGIDYDYATVKYDSNGNELWATLYDGPAHDTDWAEDIAVDDFGNAYVTGVSDGAGTGDDYATVMYYPDGTEHWVARYNGSVDGQDWAQAITVDDEGKIYVTGFSDGIDSDRDYATVKYNANGEELWVARYNGERNGSDYANDITVDREGNVYVTGESWTSNWFDYTTLKYDNDGNQLWTAGYDGAGPGSDYANAIAVDVVGNVYVTGESTGEGTSFDITTVKYGRDGSEKWVARYDGPAHDEDYGFVISLQRSSAVYVAGFSSGLGRGRDCTTIRYDSDGNELWVTTYDGSGHGQDQIHALTLDEDASIYVAGTSMSEGNTGNDFITIKYFECPYILLMKDTDLEPGLDLLRRLRDGFFKSSPLGESYIQEFNKFANSVTRLFLTNPSLIPQVRESIRILLDTVEPLLSFGEDHASRRFIDKNEYEQVRNTLLLLSVKADPKLSNFIVFALNEMEKYRNRSVGEIRLMFR